MLFSDLPNLLNDGERIDANSLQRLLPVTPIDVITQVYSDHGLNGYFQYLYGNIEIDRLQWKEMSVEGRLIIKCSVNNEFIDYLLMTASKVDKNTFNDLDGVLCGRYKEQGSWIKTHSWILPPVFIDPKIINITNKELHLVEGHTRIGLLKGFIKCGFIAPEKCHRIYLGSYV